MMTLTIWKLFKISHWPSFLNEVITDVKKVIGVNAKSVSANDFVLKPNRTLWPMQVIFFAFILLLSSLFRSCCLTRAFHTTSASAYGAQQYLTKQLGRNMWSSKCAMQLNYVIIVLKNKLWKKQGCGKRSKGARLDQIGKAFPQKRRFLSRGPFPICLAQAPHLWVLEGGAIMQLRANRNHVSQNDIIPYVF